MTEATKHEIDLAGHRVVFAHRITGADLFQIDTDPQSQNPTQYQDLIMRAAIVEFDSLKMPVPLNVLLDLDSVDRDDLTEGHNQFQVLSLGERSGEVLADFKARLAFGFRVGELTYPLVHFGRRITGRDEVAADLANLGAGIARLCFLIGRQISKIETADGAASLEGPIDIENFKSLDGADIFTLRGAAEVWRQTFRLGRGATKSDGAAAGSGNPGA